MLKQLLDPNSEKALKKALDTLDLSFPDQRQVLVDLVLTNQHKLSESELLKQIKDSKALFELFLNAEEALQHKLEPSLREVLSSSDTQIFEQNKALLEKYLQPLNSKAIFSFSVLCENSVLFSLANEKLNTTEKMNLLPLLKTEELKRLILSEINDIETLKTLEKSLANKDKKSYRLTQEKIQTLENEKKEKEELKLHCQKLLASMETLSKSSYAPLYDSKFQHLLDEWELLQKKREAKCIQLEQLADKSTLDEFEKNIEDCKKIIHEHQEQESEEKRRNKDALFLEGALEKLKNFVTAEKYSKEASETLKQSIEDKLSNSEVPKDFDYTLYENLKKIIQFEEKITTEDSLLSELDERIAHFESLFSSNHKKKKAEHNTLNEIETLISKVKTLRNYAENKNLESENKRLLNEKIKKLNAFKSQSLSTQDEFRAKFDKKTGYIKSEVENKALTTVSRLCKEAEEIIPYCRLEQHEQLEKRLSTYKEELAKLEDWYNFATLPKRKELLEKMEALAKTSKQTKIKVLKEEIKRLQNEWRELGHARDDEGKSIWEKFKEQGDLAYQPIKELIDKKESEKQQNLETRNNILAQMGAQLEALNSQSITDFKEVEKFLNRASRQWKDAFPVPSGNHDVQEQFSELNEKIEQKLKPQRKVNIGKKKELIASARQLLQLDNNRDATEKAKTLQQEWRLIGIAEDDQDLWKEFREICDEVFKERDQLKEKQRSEEKQAIQLAQEICLALENIDKDSAEQYEAEYKKLCSQFEDIRDLPKKRNDINKQFSRAKKNSAKQLEILKQKERSKTLETLSALCKELAPLEKAILSGEGGESALESAKALLQASTLDKDIISLLENNLVELFESKNKSSLVKERKQALRELCVSLEIELDKDTPMQDKTLRMEIQVKRLNQKFNSSNKNKSLEQQITEGFLVGGLYSYQEAANAERLLGFQQNIVRK